MEASFEAAELPTVQPSIVMLRKADVSYALEIELIFESVFPVVLWIVGIAHYTVKGRPSVEAGWSAMFLMLTFKDRRPPYIIAVE